MMVVIRALIRSSTWVLSSLILISILGQHHSSRGSKTFTYHIVMILGSLPLNFPHFFNHFSFLYASPFVPSALPYFSEYSSWFPLYNSLMTPLLPHFKSYHFLLPFLDCQLLPALSLKLFHHYLLSGMSPFTLQSHTIDSWPTRGCQHPYDSFNPYVLSDSFATVALLSKQSWACI